MRAVLGRRSGPITISATTAMTTISEKPMSNMGWERFAQWTRCRPFEVEGPSTASPRAARRSHFLRRLLAHFTFDRLAGDLWGRLGRRRSLGVGLAGLHAFLEALDRPTQVLTDVAELLRAENQHDDQKDDQPVPNAQSTHVFSYWLTRASIDPSGAGPPSTWTCTCITSWLATRPVLTMVRNPSAAPCSR